MIYRVYAVLDKAVGAFAMPIFLRSDAEAIRSFADAVNTPDHQFQRHAEHYSLYHLGEWDDNSGLTVSLSDPIRVIAGSQCVVVNGDAQYSAAGPASEPRSRKPS